MNARIRKSAVALVASTMLLGAAAPAIATAPTDAARSSSALSAATDSGPARCATPWGRGAKGNRPVELSSNTHVVGVRTGRHACFDRIVVDLDRDLAAKGYTVRYVKAVHEEGSGRTISLRGGAAIEVVIGAPAYDDRGRETLKVADRAEVVSTRSLRTVRQVAFAGSFEGQTTLGVGVAKRTPMRSFVLTSSTGGRLVIDIAHR